MTQFLTVRAIALRVRVAIESVSHFERPPELVNFPNGACGSSSLLLGAILVDNGYANFKYVCGERPSQDGMQTISHAWLTDGHLIADITAKQFCDAPEEVVFIAESPWHRTFSLVHTEPADFRASQGPGTFHLWRMYSKVSGLLTQHE